MEESFVLKFFFTGNEGTPPRNIQEWRRQAWGCPRHATRPIELSVCKLLNFGFWANRMIIETWSIFV
jgi:hypothetical protein